MIEHKHLPPAPNTIMTNRILIWSQMIRRERVEFYWDFDKGQFSIFSQTAIFDDVWLTAGITLDKAITNTERLVDAIYMFRGVQGKRS